MSDATVSSRMLDVAEEMRAVTAFGQRVLEGRLGPDACDFMFGNPQEPPLRGLVEAIIRHAEPRDVHWFGYQKYDQSARDAVARTLRKVRGSISSRQTSRSQLVASAPSQPRCCSH